MMYKIFIHVAIFALVFQRTLSAAAFNNGTKSLKVLVSTNDFLNSGMKILEEHFTVLKTRYHNISKEDANRALLEMIPGCSALVWASHDPITTELLDRADEPWVCGRAYTGPQLKIVSAASAGYNHCNVAELKKRGIRLTNTPQVLSGTVAEIAVSLMLAASRRFTEGLNQVRSGQWEVGFDKLLGQDIKGSTVGIVGFGGIGQAVVKRLSGFEVGQFLYTNRREKPEAKQLGAIYVDLDTLLTLSDFVILAVPLNGETRHMINKNTLGKMKKNAILVNVGRGDLINQDDLFDALKKRDIYAAGLDVTTPEPLPEDHKLLTLPNIFILPHIGSKTIGTRNSVAILAANNVVNALNGKPLLTPVFE